MNIHFIAIGGSIMHSLAIELKRHGHIITGSDDFIYDPAKSNLNKYNLLPKEFGFCISNIHDKLDLVILGMHAKIDNPELLEAQKKNITISSFPEFIFNYSKQKKRIVIAGSHGKTTITGMIIHVLNQNNIALDYLIGARINALSNQVKLDNNDIIIIEGDEYLSSPIDVTPKFIHYHADILVVSGVSWDHVNVFPTLNSYQSAFKSVCKQVFKSSGQIFFYKHDPFLLSFLKNKHSSIQSYSLPEYEVIDGKFNLIVNSNSLPLSIFGQHNLCNIAAAKSVCDQLGVSDQDFYTAIQTFQGASKRLDLIKEIDNHSCVYYDFAHSPSKVSATINAVRELYPNRYLIACLELHTFSSLNKDFIPNYSNIFLECNEVFIYIPKKELKRKRITEINPDYILHLINHDHVTVIEDVQQLRVNLSNLKLDHTNLLMMSSGNFSGLDIASIFM